MNVPEIYAIFLICFLSGIFVGAVLLAFYDASHENDWRSAERLARAADEVEKNGKRKA